MTILLGHPTGNPFAHHAALAYLTEHWLECFCVPWMPSPQTLGLLESLPPLRPIARRFGRRQFAPLAKAPKVQGRLGELARLMARATRSNGDQVAEEANQWLMQTMARELRRPNVTLVHAYEDCSLSEFEVAKKQGRACIYELPIGYFAAWDRTEAELACRYADWMPPRSAQTHIDRRERKRKEIGLADLVLAPSTFVAETIAEHYDAKPIAIVPYGADLTDWQPPSKLKTNETLTFLFAGQCSLRKGVPLLLKAWRAAGLKDAKLQLVGSWQMSEAKRSEIPLGCTYIEPVAASKLRSLYQAADVFVFPTFFEGRALVVCEALASGLPVLTTQASGGSDLISEESGRIVPVGDLDALVEGLRWFSNNRDRLTEMSQAARQMAQRASWDNYRRLLIEAVGPFV